MPPLYISGERFESYSYIVLPYCTHGTLIDLLINAQDKQLRLSTDLMKYLFRQIVDCLDYLHNVNGLAHLDIKPDNIVINDDLTLAFIDFGHTNSIDQTLDSAVGTDSYMPSEVR